MQNNKILYPSPRANRLPGWRTPAVLTISLLLAFSLCSSPAFALGGEEAVVQALSITGTSHGLPSAEELEQMAGGEDALVAILLNYRTKESPPFVGIRSQRFLLQYAQRRDVQEALASDVQSEQYFGLARIVSVHLDSVSDQGARRRLARLVLERSAREQRFVPYGRQLLESGDDSVRRLAREAFPE